MWLYVPSACAPESAASTWDLNALERLAASATSSGKHSPPRVWSRRCNEASWPKRLSGVTFEPSTLERGVAAWISSQADTPANRFHSPVGAKARTIPDTSGPKSCGSTATLAPDTCSARTSPDTFRLGSPLFLPSLPKWGRLSNGACSARPMLERRTNENGYSSWPSATVSDAASAARHTTKTRVMHSGTSLTDAMRLWPTPDAMVAQNGETAKTWLERRERIKAKGYNGNGMGTPLTIAAAMWPTPTEDNANNSGGPSRSAGMQGRGFQDLTVAAAMWPTPAATEARQGFQDRTRGKKGSQESLSTVAALSPLAPKTPNNGANGSQLAVLNPPFVEALMGFPIGWTDCVLSETPSCPK